jgi:hypothetical protein
MYVYALSLCLSLSHTHTVEQFVDRVSGTQVSSTAIINTPEVVASPFFPHTLLTYADIYADVC